MANIKEELFFMRRIFKEGYGLSGYLRYLKNKFWGTIYDLPGFNYPESESNRDFELHVLCQRKDFRMLAWSLTSFLYYSGLTPLIFIHDDGSINKKSAEVLESKFSN